jgi:hypothetical protein
MHKHYTNSGVISPQVNYTDKISQTLGGRSVGIVLNAHRNEKIHFEHPVWQQSFNASYCARCNGFLDDSCIYIFKWLEFTTLHAFPTRTENDN